MVAGSYQQITIITLSQRPSTSLWDAGYSTVKIGVEGGRTKKKNMQRAKQSSNFWSILSYYDRTCFRSSKDKWRNNMNFVLRLKIYFSLRTMFWTMYFLFVGVLFTDCLIVYIILITLFMIWEQCLILNTGKTVLRRKFHFARGVRGFVNSAWRWGFVFNVFRKWSKVSEIVF